VHECVVYVELQLRLGVSNVNLLFAIAITILVLHRHDLGPTPRLVPLRSHHQQSDHLALVQQLKAQAECRGSLRFTGESGIDSGTKR
jgi:hypothetical protein